MDYSDLITITDAYRALLHEERVSIDTLALAQAHVEQRKAAVLVSAVIDGKNADARKQQATQALAEDAEHQHALTDLWQQEQKKAKASVEVEHTRAVIGLTKAWLYSQSGIS